MRLNITTYAVVVIVGSCLTINAHGVAGSIQEVVSHSSSKLDVKVSVESLCPGCQMFLTTELIPTYQLLGPDIMDVEVVVFGNAEIDLDSKTVDCQHGPGECDANVWEQCATSIYPYSPRYLPFLECLDNILEPGHRDDPFDEGVFYDCARQTAIDFASIKACHDDPDEAWEIQVKAYKATPSDHTYVPWVEINGKHVEMDNAFSFLEQMCHALEQNGGTHPACHEVKKSEEVWKERC